MELNNNMKDITGDPKKAVKKLAYPIIISMLLIMSNNLIDSIWIAGLGPEPLAAIGFVTPLFLILVGIGTGKANEVPDAIKKAVQAATKHVVRVSIVDERTIPHEAIGVRGASKVLLKPAAEGTGVKAGGPVRSVLELAGVKDILSKSLGSNTKINMAYATLEALKSQKTAEQIAKLRGKKVEEIL